jgi:hypothetical protein
MVPNRHRSEGLGETFKENRETKTPPEAGPSDGDKPATDASMTYSKLRPVETSTSVKYMPTETVPSACAGTSHTAKLLEMEWHVTGDESPKVKRLSVAGMSEPERPTNSEPRTKDLSGKTDTNEGTGAYMKSTALSPANSYEPLTPRETKPGACDGDAQDTVRNVKHFSGPIHDPPRVPAP